MIVDGYWVPQFSEVFHCRGEAYTTICSDMSNVLGINRFEKRICVPFSCIEENQPLVIYIGNVEIPAPLRMAPEFGEEYWVVDIASPEGAFVETWTGDEIETTWLNDGLVHKSHAKAVLHANALIGFSKVST